MTAPPMVRTGAAMVVAVVLTAVLTGAHASPAAAQDTGWSFEGELSTVLTEGNASSLTLGAGARLTRTWENSRWRIGAAGVRTQSGTTTRTAVGTESDFEVFTDTERRTTAENYSVKTRYDRDLSEASHLYGATDWLRNTFAGIESRLILGLGAGRTWWDDDRSRLETGVGATFTFEDDVVKSGSGDFPGLRANYDYERQLTETSGMESALVADLNLDEIEDVRLEWTNAFSVAINSALALEPSLELQWRNQPSLTEVPLISVTGMDTEETVLVPLEKLDTQFRLALVVTL